MLISLILADVPRLGHNHSAMMYMVLGASTLNMVLSHLDDTDTSGWSSEMMVKEIKHQFEGWDPWFVCTLAVMIRDTVANSYSLVTLINMMKPNPANWPVFQVKPLPRLTSKSGKFLLMGDAAHAMAFYLSMGEFHLFNAKYASSG
jgi:salicylate hydroxylase